MKHLDFFSGIGGFALACQWAGIETIGFVEIDKYCQKVLRKHWPDVPIVEDIRDVARIKEIVANAQKTVCQQSGDTRPGRAGFADDNKDGNSVLPRESKSPTILITAGFPCQPFSVAGKRGGKEDDRYLWPETLAVIKAIKPSWVLLENVTGIINLALDTVLSDLEGAGYSTETLIIPACAVNAPHRRDRVWIVAYDERIRCTSWANSRQGRNNGESPCTKTEQRSTNVGDSQCSQLWKPQQRSNRKEEAISAEYRQTDCSTRGACRTSEIWRASDRPISQQDAANTQREGLERADTERDSRSTGQPLQSSANTRLLGQAERQQQTAGTTQSDWWAVEPELGRVAHGIPHRVDRLKCLGNAIVPQVAFEIIKMIKEWEL